jgi:RNA polymerase-interacting CarD/CdnL/TRCF family regulator
MMTEYEKAKAKSERIAALAAVVAAVKDIDSDERTYRNRDVLKDAVAYLSQELNYE